MKSLALLPLFLLAAACADKTPPPEPVIKTVYVNVPVVGACVPKTLGSAPTYVDTDEALLNAPDAASRYQLLYGGRLQRVSRLGELEPIVQSCPKEK